MKAAIYCRKSSEQSGDSERRNPRPRVDRIRCHHHAASAANQVACRGSRMTGSWEFHRVEELITGYDANANDGGSCTKREDRNGPPDSRSVDCVNWTMWWRSVCRVTSRILGKYEE
jgi:hypothetical protein